VKRVLELERALREEERAEAAHDFVAGPRPLRATGPVPRGRLLVDDRRSAGPWLALVDGPCVLDAASGLEHAPAERARVYAEGGADLSGTRVRRPTATADRAVATRDVAEAAARGVRLGRDGAFRVHGGWTTDTLTTLAGGEPHPLRTGSAPDTRVRSVGAEDDPAAVLGQVVALEAEVYEPERRDPPEKLRKAFDDPDGVVALAERRIGDRWELVGFALGVPLERVANVDGVKADPHFGREDTLYALTTTLSPRARGLGLGMAVKVGSVRAAAAQRRPDGSPRYRWIAGRTRVGATAAMMRINRRLGADIVATLEGQYGGDGVAAYYRMPVGSPWPGPGSAPDAGPIALNDARVLLRRPPPSHEALRDAGGLYGPWMSPVEPNEHWTTPAVERARRLFAVLHGELPHVAFGRSHQELTAQLDLGLPRDPNGAADRIASETRTAGWRGLHERFFLARRMRAALWSPCQGLYVLHSRTPVHDTGGDPLTIVRARHDVAHVATLEHGRSPLEDAFRAHGFEGGETVGQPRFFERDIGDEVGAMELGAAARERGVVLGESRTRVFAALPWDLTDLERAAIAKVLEDVFR